MDDAVHHITTTKRMTVATAADRNNAISLRHDHILLSYTNRQDNESKNGHRVARRSQCSARAPISTMQCNATPKLTTTRHDTTRHDTTRHDTTRYDTIRYDTTRHDTTRHDTTRHDTTTITLTFDNQHGTPTTTLDTMDAVPTQLGSTSNGALMIFI
jgi:hypothetical protein